MRLFTSRGAMWLLFATTSSTLALAQPATRDHRRAPPPPPPQAPVQVNAGPTSAPPSPREEKVAARAGFVWVGGNWDWRNNKWEWVAGHWERERAGKKWRPARWEQHDGRWARVDGDWIDDNTPAMPPPGAWPTSAPPPPRDEKFQPRAGFVWIAGQWDWRNNKWEWVAGHWERERAGKRWNPSRWEQRDGRWARVEGGWVDAAAPMPPPPPPPGHQRRPRQWKLELPVVSSYWPAKGKPGSRVTIRGKNFPATAEVVFAGQPVKAAKIKDDQIVFVVPQGAASGDIALRAGGRRALPVGMFEVAAGFDPVAEQRRLEQERQKAAEAAWKARQQQLAKDRAAREQWLREREQERQATRDQRRAERIAALNAKWARAFLADPDTQSELTLHAQRVAELERAKEVAEVANNGKLVIRIGVAQSREDERHQQRMAALQASFNANGGQP